MATESTALEDRVVSRLASAGLLRRKRRHLRGFGSLAVAALAGAGLVLGIQSLDEAGGGRAAGQTYLLALYEGPSYRPAAQSGSRAEEYGRWADAHSRGPAVVTDGMELKGTAVLIGAAPTDARQLAGYFLVRAGNRDAALALARTNPHIRHGGTVVVHDTAS